MPETYDDVIVFEAADCGHCRTRNNATVELKRSSSFSFSPEKLTKCMSSTDSYKNFTYSTKTKMHVKLGLM